MMALAAGLALGAAPQVGIAQVRGSDRLDVEIREARRQEELARQRRQRLERQRDAVGRATARGRVSDRRDVDIRLGDVIRGREVATRSRGNGPPFCRSGQGHPVHGRQWCVDKGWGLGGRDVRLDRRRDDDDVVIRRIPRDRGDRGDGSVLDRLGDIIRGRTR
jgi:hypothetical protein